MVIQELKFSTDFEAIGLRWVILRTKHFISENITFVNGYIIDQCHKLL